MAALTVDASVAFKWFLPEPGTLAALALHGEGPLIAPDFICLEVFNALQTAARRGRIDAQALIGIPALIAGPFTQLAPSQELFDAAAKLSLQLDATVCDCLYIALAQREKSELVTDDGLQFAAARKARVKARLI